MERTFAIIKPDAVAAGRTGDIISFIELNKFNVIGLQKILFNRLQAEEFYGIHKEKSFFGELVDYMLSGPVVVMVLEKQNAIQEWRDAMGATNPAKAGPGTLRRMFGASIGSNAVHGSDSYETAEIEIAFFFPDLV
jgi:nucleoside-diphosphate kinase